MATRLLSRKEFAEELWQLFTECCDAEGLDDDGRTAVLNAIGCWFFAYPCQGRPTAPVSS